MRKKVHARLREKNRQSRIKELRAELDRLLRDPDADPSPSPFQVKEIQLAQLAERDLNMGERFLMTLLIYRSNAQTGKCYPGLPDLERLMGCYRSEVTTIRERCRKKGVLSWEGSKGKKTHYTLHLLNPLVVDDSEEQPVGPRPTSDRDSSDVSQPVEREPSNLSSESPATCRARPDRNVKGLHKNKEGNFSLKKGREAFDLLSFERSKRTPAVIAAEKEHGVRFSTDRFGNTVLIDDAHGMPG